MRSQSLLFLALVAVASPAWAAGAEAQAAAEVLFQDAKKLAAAGDFAAACPKFAESQRLDPGSGTALHLAACYERQDKLASAWGTFREAESIARNTNNSLRAAEAARRAEALAPRLAKLTIAVSPGARVPGLEVRRDEGTVGEGQWGASLPADAGQHTVAAAAPGYKSWSTVVLIETDGATATVEVPPLEKLPEKAASGPPPSMWSTQRIAGVSVGSAGVVGLAIGTAFGIVTLGKTNSAKSHCSATLPECDATGVGLENSARTTARVSDAALALGGAALVGGVVVFFTAPASGPKTSGAVRLGPLLGQGQAGLAAEGRW